MRTRMIITINPCLTHGLVTLYWTDIMRLSEIIPRDDFYNIHLVADIDQRLPSSSVQVFIAEVNPLGERFECLQHTTAE
jgi:hypothetical protein